ncbi:MAG TPA: phosphoribosylformylglycinamidine synthase subunit PurQ, partial [Planctomycetota bacterium]|nr:phosphoribosylformylglycinamidine synthase subunit PurQ [Planctomycetota bacterium]
MITPSVLVVRAAGTNCDAETAFAFQRFGARSEIRHVNALLADPGQLERHHVLAFPGGFAYGDDA